MGGFVCVSRVRLVPLDDYKGCLCSQLLKKCGRNFKMAKKKEQRLVLHDFFTDQPRTTTITTTGFDSEFN